MFKQLDNYNYLLVNDYDDIYSSDGYFFYDLLKYHKDKIIIDLPTKFMISGLYLPYTDFLAGKGFKIAYKGICGNDMFGLPTFNNRLIIVASKNSDNLLLHNMFKHKDEFVTPISLLCGKPLDKLTKEFNNALKVNFSSEMIDDVYDYAMSKFDRSLMSDFISNSSNLNDRRIKFKDGSNSRKKGKIKTDIYVDDIIKPYGHIIDKHLEYYHYNPKRNYCTIREIARLNGVPDGWTIDIKDRKVFIDKIHSMISPYIINKIWRALY